MAIKDGIQRMRADIRSAYKSEETEGFFDKIFTKPLGYLWARVFIRLDWSPNMVTLLSMGIGFAGGLLFYPKSFTINLIGALLIVWANILDSTDGQMARLTGKRSTVGRILDALSTSVWYAAIYAALCLRLMNAPIPFAGGRVWGGWIWLIAVVCALFGHERQCMMADYYRNIHLFFLKCKHGSEPDSSSEIARLRAGLPKKGMRFQKAYLFFYGIYTYVQELSTPNLQRLLRGIRASGSAPSERVRDDYLTKSRRYIKLTNILTFNARACTLFVCVLLGVPAVYFPLELLAFGALNSCMCRKYEDIASDVLVSNRLPGAEEKPEKRKIYPILFFGVGVVGITLMLTKTDLGGINWGEILSKVHIWLPALISLWALIYILHVFAYRTIMGGCKKNIGFFHMLKIVISGFALNNVTPVGFAGGEPYRIMEMKPYVGTEKATASTLTFTIMHTFSHLMFWTTGGVVCLALYGFSQSVLAGMIALLVAAAGLFVLYAFLRSSRKGLTVPVMTFFSRIPLVGRSAGRFLENKRGMLESIDREIAAFHLRKADFFITMLIEYATRLMEVVEFYILFRLLSVDISFFACIVSLASASLIGNLMFFMPMQVGAREAGLALALSWAGVPASYGVTVSLLSRLREVFYVGVGVLAMLINGSSPRAAGEKTPEAREENRPAEDSNDSET